MIAVTGLLILLPVAVRAQSSPPGSGKDEADFRKLTAQLAAERPRGDEESAASEEAALAILDRFALQGLRSSGESDLEALNRRLGALVTQQRAAGQNYAVVCLGGSPAVFALAANFGVSGPSAVRLYARGPQAYQLSARIDHVSQSDFFDDYLELLPIALRAIVFVTVTGRTDELATGMFMAWRFEGGRLENLWSSDLLPQSSYIPRPDGLEITYCAETDEDQPSVCRRKVRDRYSWDGASWKRVEQTRLPAQPH